MKVQFGMNNTKNDPLHLVDKSELNVPPIIGFVEESGITQHFTIMSKCENLANRACLEQLSLAEMAFCERIPPH
ncbi:hypothetical protein CCR75_007092 [Bremia lactucae]|uniref:Uncharacterized protein n=1 Tax=Bremia lactucae TaxID=4779 RepID=A0A976FS01_BRELC|nr:hypothetical protein CCR75_007092 [Bremia lactucae]